LTLSLVVSAVINDPSPATLIRFTIPDDNNFVSILLFDQSRSMDVHLDPKPKTKMATKARAEGDYWVIYFGGHTEPELRLAKAMLRRVEQTTLGMPDAWFKYRNYFTKTPNTGDEADESQQSGQPSVRVGENTVDLGHGHSIRFTGALASFEWLSLSGHQNIRPARPPVEDEAKVQQRDPEAAIIRRQAAKLGSGFSHSHLEHGVMVTGSGTYSWPQPIPICASPPTLVEQGQAKIVGRIMRE
jgi:hypothetical protein